MLSIGFDRMVNKMPKKRHILNLAKNLSLWSYRILETGPQWSKKRASQVMNNTNIFISNLEEQFYQLKSLHCHTDDQALEELYSYLFNNVRCKKVLLLSLELGIKAPPGFHSMFKKSSKEYMRIIYP